MLLTAAFRAWSRSLTRSSRSSTPTDSLIRLSVMPRDSRSSRTTEAWVIMPLMQMNNNGSFKVSKYQQCNFTRKERPDIAERKYQNHNLNEIYPYVILLEQEILEVKVIHPFPHTINSVEQQPCPSSSCHLCILLFIRSYL